MKLLLFYLTELLAYYTIIEKKSVKKGKDILRIKFTAHVCSK